MTYPDDNTPRRLTAKPDKRTATPFVIAAAVGLGLLAVVWALSDSVGSNKSNSPQTNQSTGLGTGSVDQPMKSDLQK